MADFKMPPGSAGAIELTRDEVTPISPPAADKPADFSSGKFAIDDLKALDIETAELFEISAVTTQLLNVVKSDGIWDGEKVMAVPLAGRQAANLTTEIKIKSGKPPKEQEDLLFSVEIAYWIAQIAHELDSRQLFGEKLKDKYVPEPAQLLADWAKTNQENFTVQLVEQKNHWSNIVNAFLDVRGALQAALTPETKDVGAEAKAEALAAEEKVKLDDDDDDLDLDPLTAKSESEGGGTSETEGVTEKVVGDTRQRIPITAPQDVMRAFLQAGGGEEGKASNSTYLRELKGLGFSAKERRLIIDQTAWIYSGVLAQVYPNAIGHFESLDLAARAQINQLVRDYIMSLPNREAALAGLIANPLGRRELILDILQKNSPQLSFLAQRDEKHFQNAVAVNSREDIIAQQLPELETYLITKAGAQGTVLSPAEAKTQAYNALSNLDSAQLRGLEAGLLTVREQVYESAVQATAQSTLVSSLSTIADASLEKLDIKNIILSLDGILLNLAEKGLTKAEILDYFTDLPASELLLLMSIDPSNPLFATYLANIQSIRNAVQFYVQEKILILDFAQIGVKKEGVAPDRKQHVKQTISATLSAPTAITPATVNNSGKTTTEIAQDVKQTTTDKGKAFFKYYQERWDSRSVDEQAVVCILTDARVDPVYLQQNPPTEHMGPALGFIDLETEVGKEYFQELVRQFSLNRSAYKSHSKRQELKALFEKRSVTEIQSAQAVAFGGDIQKAQQFEDKYRSLWSTLSYNEKVTVYALAGATFAAGQELKPIAAFVDYADSVGTPGFNELVKVVTEQPQALETEAGQAQFQQMVAQLGADTSTSQAILQEQQADVAATQYMLANMEVAQQQALAQAYGHENPAEFIQAQQEQVQQIGGGGVSPEELAFTGSNAIDNSGSAGGSSAVGSNAASSLNAFRQARATNTALPGVGRLRQSLGKQASTASSALLKKGISLASNALPLIGKGVVTLAQHKYGRYVLAAPLLLYLKAISSWGGAGGALVGGTLGAAFPVAGIATPFLGSFFGALIGDWLNSQFGGGSWLPFRTPPSPFAEPMVQSAYPSQAASAAAQQAAAEAGTQQLISYQPAASAATSAAAATAPSILGTFMWPLYALGAVVAMSLTVMLVIWGAFLAPAPTKPLPALPGTDPQVTAKFITVTKIAEPNQFENPTGGQTYDVKYTITITPKSGYKIKVTGITDEFSSFGETPVVGMASPVTFEKLKADIIQKYPDELITGDFVIEYTLTGITGVDAYLINQATVQFDTYDYLGTPPDKPPATYTPINTAQKYVASAVVIIGEPTVGCFEMGAGGLQLGSDGGPIISQDFTPDEISIFAQALTHPVMTNPTYIGLLCGGGPITIYRAQGGGRSWWGYGGIPRAIVFYDLSGSDAFTSPAYFLYNFVHESAHIIDSGSRVMYRRQFAAILPANLYGCFTYPLPNNCAAGEAFAEATMLYVINRLPWQTPEQYDFKNSYPVPYDWLRENIFGGIEYTN